MSDHYNKGQMAADSRLGDDARDSIERALFLSNLHMPAYDTPLRREDIFALEDFFVGFCDRWLERFGYPQNLALERQLTQAREHTKKDSLTHKRVCENYHRLLLASRKKSK